MKVTFEILCIILSASWVLSSIAGINYMDPLIQKPLKYLPGANPCNPLYWYPRHRPDYCYQTLEEQVPPQPKPVVPQPLPPAAPMPMPPIPMPMPIPFPVYPMPIYPSVPQFVPPPLLPQMPSPYGVPIPGNSMPIPIPGPYPYPYPSYYPQQSGLVPGVQGLVSPDGGINILPFSDAYSDMLEKHKQKEIRKKLQKVLDDYENFPRKRNHRKYRERF